LEADILKRLSEAQGNILDDEDLINTLAESKKVSIMIGKRMEAAVVTKQEIDEAREAYRTVATRGSIIYFVIADMAQIDPMYQCGSRRPVIHATRLHLTSMRVVLLSSLSAFHTQVLAAILSSAVQPMSEELGAVRGPSETFRDHH
jgi:hypothetical protein